MQPSITGRCGRNGLPIGPFSGGSSGSIRAHCASVNIAVIDIDRPSTLNSAQQVRHALGGSLVKSLGDGVLLGLPPVTDPLALVRRLAAELAATAPVWRLHAAAHV